MESQDEIRMIGDTARRFMSAEVEPNFDRWESEGMIPRELWHKLGAAGLLCIDVPEAYGGGGTSIYGALPMTNEIFGRYGSLIGLSAHSDLVAHYFVNHGTEVQKRHYLPKMASGELVGAIAMSEPSAGSDLQGIQTVARRDQRGFSLSGAKTFITNGQVADFALVAAKTDVDAKGSDGISLLIVDLHAEGAKRGKKLDKIGLRGSDTSELFFEDVAVYEDALVGPLNGGFKVLMEELPRERVVAAAGAVAAIRGALDHTIEYIKERRAFGRRIADFQNTRFRIAEMETQYALNKALVADCYRRFVQGALDSPTAAMAKLAATEAQCDIVDSCLQLFGGYGYTHEYPIARYYVDARIQRIYGGTSEIMKEIISRAVLC